MGRGSGLLKLFLNLIEEPEEILKGPSQAPDFPYETLTLDLPSTN
jgi:hypothetical protein